ncbi:MAG: spermidine synthase [Methylophagaceae bacterium]|jgi:spermidine synthase
MHLYDGLVVHQSQSDDGVIEVVDDGDIRSLHFGTFPRQSCMSLKVPHTLELSYTEAMMAALLLNSSPRRVLVVGLGGGSLVKYLLHHFPECHIDVVEYREDVVKVAHGYFHVPEKDERLIIHVGDGYLFVQEQYYKNEVSYDMLLVDAYDHVGMAASVGIQSFFDACAGLLTKTGVMSINLWGTNRPTFKQSLKRINTSFEGRNLVLPVEDKGNVICLATKQLVTQSNLKRLKSSVEALEDRFQINLPRSLYELTRRNRPIIGKLFL